MANVGINVDETSPAGPVTIGPSAANEPVTVNNDGAGSAKAIFAHTQRIGALTIAAGGTAALLTGRQVLTVPSLSAVGTGRLDLSDGGMIVDYTGATPAPLVRTLLTSGRAGGAWNGPGIDSSAAAARNGSAIGYAEASALPGHPATFMGQTIDDTSLLLRYTLSGDTNLDGKVDFSDLVQVAQNYNATSARTWITGDFNYDGKPDFADLVSVAQNYNIAAAPLPTAPAPTPVASPTPPTRRTPFASSKRLISGS